MIELGDACKVLSARGAWRIHCLLSGGRFCYYYYLANLWNAGNSKVEEAFEEKKGTEPGLSLNLLATEWLRYPIPTPGWVTRRYNFLRWNCLFQPEGGKKIGWTCVCSFIAPSATHIFWARRRKRWCSRERKACRIHKQVRFSLSSRLLSSWLYAGEEENCSLFTPVTLLCRKYWPSNWVCILPV